MKKNSSRLVIMLTLLGISSFSSDASATWNWCAPHNELDVEDGLTVIEYGFGQTAHAHPSADFEDGNNGIYVFAEAYDGVSTVFALDAAMNLNNQQRMAVINTLKTALLTGTKVKLGSTNGCRTIQYIAMISKDRRS